MSDYRGMNCILDNCPKTGKKTPTKTKAKKCLYFRMRHHCWSTLIERCDSVNRFLSPHTHTRLPRGPCHLSGSWRKNPLLKDAGRADQSALYATQPLWPIGNLQRERGLQFVFKVVLWQRQTSPTISVQLSTIRTIFGLSKWIRALHKAAEKWRDARALPAMIAQERMR